MSKPVFDFTDYKEYLRQRFPSSGEGRGLRTRLAAHLRCQGAFVSKVLNGSAHFSLEHAVQISDFLAHSREEQEFFVLLLSFGRAGSKALEEHYRAQIRAILDRRQEIQTRVKAKNTLDESDQAVYYSSWYFGAIHVLVSIPGFNTRAALGKRLGLPPAQLDRYLEFLVRSGILVEREGAYHVGSARLHLGKDSPLISKHHTNWRMRAIHALDRQDDRDLHYSLAFSLSREDVDKIRGVLMSAIERTEEIMRPSKEETAYCLLMDYFAL